jgi:hypothetical protein
MKRRRSGAAIAVDRWRAAAWTASVHAILVAQRWCVVAIQGFRGAARR